MVLLLALCCGPAVAAAQTAERPEGEPVLTPPRLVDAPPLELPPDTEPVPEGSAVELQITVDETGAVGEVEILTPLREDIDPLVIEAARGMRFEPATRNGTPIPAQVRFSYRVRIAPEPPPEDETGATQDGDASEAEAAEGAEDAQATDAEADEPSLAETEAELDMLEDTEGFGATARVRREEAGAATRITLEAEELTTVPGTFGEPLRVVATLPGVARTPFNLGYFIVRGASFENTGFFVDGFPVPILYHLGAGPAVLSSRLVESMDFYPGGYPAHYGRFIGGIISLDTQAPDHDGLRLEAEVDLFRASALAVVPVGERGTVTAAYRRSYYDLIIPLVVDGLELAYSDWQVRFDYDLTDRLSASLFWFGSEDLLDQREAAGAGISDEETQTGLEYTFQRLIGKLTLKLPDNVQLEWAGTVGIEGSEIRRREPGGFDVGAEIDGVTLGQRLELIAPFEEIWQTTAGVDVSTILYDARTSFPIPPGYGEYPQPTIDPQTTDVTVRPIIMTAAPYLEQVVRPGDFEIAGGLRLEYLRYANYSGVSFDPRGVVRYAITPELTAKVATGLFTQPPQPFQIDHRFGNPELRPNRSWQSSAGVEVELPEDVYVESQLFYSRMWQLPRTQDVLTGAGREVFADDGEGRAYGWELMVRRRIEDGLFGWLSYTLAWSERFTEGGQTVPFFFDQRHTLNIAASYAISGWRFGARLQLSSGRPTRPVLDADEDVDRYAFDAVRDGLVDRLPTFWQLDVRIDREFVLSDALTGSVYLDVLNVFNTTNTEGQIWQYDFRRSLNLPSLPFLPTIGVRLVYE